MRPRRALGNVLVATDFSPAAALAVARAARLPITAGSSLTVLHVLPPGTDGAERAAAAHALDRIVAHVRDAVVGAGTIAVDVLPRLVEGAPSVEIVRAAHHGRNELVVVGRHGERTFRDLVLGSTTEQVLRKGDTAVLVVASPPAGPYERPLAAVDCSDPSQRAVDLASYLAGPDVAAVEVVHAYVPIADSTLHRASVFGDAAIEYRLAARRQAQSTVEEFLAGARAVPVQVTVREGDPADEIRRAASQCEADLLAVGTHGRTGAAHALLGSVAETVIRDAACDVLVAPMLGRPKA